jgi:integrase
MKDEIKVLVTSHGKRRFLMMYFDDPASGKRQWRSTKTDNQKQAEKAAAVWEEELRTGRYKPKADITWEDFRKMFFEEHLRDAPPATYRIYSTAFNAVEAICTIKKLAELDTRRIAYIADKLRIEGRSLETVRSYLTHLRAALYWAHGAELLRDKPKVVMPKRVKGGKMMKGRPITGEEFDRMISKVEAGIIAAATARERLKRTRGTKAAETRREHLAAAAAKAAPSWERFLRGLWWSGLRLGEALDLSWDNENSITVDTSAAKPRLCIAAGQDKSGEARLLPLATEFRELLLAVPKGQREGRVFPLVGINGESISDLRQVSKVISEIGKAARVTVDKASGKCASAHDLRRAFGVRWSVRVMPAVLQSMMRHADISTTMKYYVGQGASAHEDAIDAAFSRVDTSVDTSQNSSSSGKVESSQVVS